MVDTGPSVFAILIAWQITTKKIKLQHMLLYYLQGRADGLLAPLVVEEYLHFPFITYIHALQDYRISNHYVCS